MQKEQWSSPCVEGYHAWDANDPAEVRRNGNLSRPARCYHCGAETEDVERVFPYLVRGSEGGQ